MDDAYRTPGLQCPHCPGVSLREYQSRYCCDECEGILIGFGDFTSALTNLRDEEVKLEYTDETPSDTTCPRCERAFTQCRFTMVFTTKTKRFRHDVLRCDRDGLWLGHGLLTAAFCGISYRWGGGPNPGSPGQTGLDGLPSSRHRGASGGLAISSWRDKPRPRTKTLSPINAYADRELACPACATALAFQGDQYACTGCHGRFVQNGALAEMVSEMTNAPWELPAATGTAGKRACPVCAQAMLTEPLGKVAEIDRCAEHGIWFDETELGEALATTVPPEGGMVSWLKNVVFSK